MQLSSSRIIVELYGYGKYLPKDEMVSVIGRAEWQTYKHKNGVLMGHEPLQQEIDGIYFTLFPRERMTWDICSKALETMRKAVLFKDMHFEWSFIVMNEDMSYDQGELAIGNLKRETRASITSGKSRRRDHKRQKQVPSDDEIR